MKRPIPVTFSWYRAAAAQAIIALLLAIASLGCTGLVTAGLEGGEAEADAGTEFGPDAAAPLPDATPGTAADAQQQPPPQPDAAPTNQRSGQIIVEPGNPRWLAYRGGGPNFLCGPGDPEGFLYRGTRNADGTRSGDQAALISKFIGTGANGIYFQAIRSHGGDDSTGTNNPFIDSNPNAGIDNDILDQWETWFTDLESAGVTMYFFFYDDSACVWGCGGDGTVPSQEQQFIETIVNRFEHHKHIVWVVAEEYQERFSATRVGNIASAIRAADDNDHVIAVHKLNGTDFSEFADHPAMDQFAMQLNETSASGLHNGVVTAFTQAAGRYNVNMSEANNHGTGTAARQKNWAVAMGGAYVMVLGWDIAGTPVTDLKDCGRLVDFMESTNFNTMEPRSDLAAGNSQYVLANPNSNSYILYSSSLSGSLGVRGIAAGTYNLHWFDALTGAVVNQNNLSVAGGDTSWPKPAGLSSEVALWVRPAQ